MTSSRSAVVVTALCGIASLAFMMMVGRHQKSLVLMAMFTVWVASPFAAFLYGQLKGTLSAALTWPGALVSVVSATIYALVAFGPPLPQPAKFFLLVPAVAWGVWWLLRMLQVRKAIAIDKH